MEETAVTQTTKIIVFSLDKEVYGVLVDQVLSIERVESITRVPNAPSFVEGVMNLRGLIIPVINVRKRFQLNDVPLTKESRIIVVTVDEIEVGILVDSAREVMDIDLDKLEKTPEIVGGLNTKFISGIYGMDEQRLLILLDLHHVLSDQDIDDVKHLEETENEQNQ